MNVVEKLVSSIATAASLNGAIWLISTARVETAGAGAVDDVERAAGQAHDPGLQVDRPARAISSGAVVLREPLGQPELTGYVRVFEVERLERLRADPLDVPAVEELVRHGREHRAHRLADS